MKLRITSCLLVLLLWGCGTQSTSPIIQPKRQSWVADLENNEHYINDYSLKESYHAFAPIDVIAWILNIRPMSIEKRCDIEIYKNTRVWNLAVAVYEQDTAEIQKLLLKEPETVDDTDKFFGMTLLDWSIVNCRYLSAAQLLMLSANPNYVTKNGSPLIYACQNSSTPVFINLLLNYGADVNKPLPFGDNLSPFEVACSVDWFDNLTQKFNFKSLETLIKAGAEVNYVDKSNHNALYWACGQLEILKFLIIDYGVDFSSPFYFIDGGVDSGKYWYPIDEIKEQNFISADTGRLKIKKELIGFIESRYKNIKNR